MPGGTANGTFTVSVSFNEDVTGFDDLSEVTVGNGSHNNDLTGSDDSYSFTVTPAGDGNVTIDLAGG